MDKKGDVSLIEDLIVALQNLISAESHALGSYQMNKDDKKESEKWIQTMNFLREIRTRWLQIIVTKEDNSQKWCISKHILSSAMCLAEVGNRYNSEGKIESAKIAYDDSGSLIGLFMYLNGYAKDG